MDKIEEEIKDYFQGYWPGTETVEQCNTDLHFTPPAIIRLARHFAKWQKEQMMKDGNVILAEEDFDAEKEKSMEWGYNLCKEQMLKEAVEGEVIVPIYEGDDIWSAEIKIPGRYEIGDKVRIIIIKED